MEPPAPSRGTREPGCPRWCVTSPEEHEQDDPGTRLHEGPRFGLLRTWCLDGPEPVFTATLDDAIADAGELDVDELRRLATDALDAAMWMDQQTRIGVARVSQSVVELVREAHARSSRSA